MRSHRLLPPLAGLLVSQLARQTPSSREPARSAGFAQNGAGFAQNDDSSVRSHDVFPDAPIAIGVFTRRCGGNHHLESPQISARCGKRASRPFLFGTNVCGGPRRPGDLGPCRARCEEANMTLASSGLDSIQHRSRDDFEPASCEGLDTSRRSPSVYAPGREEARVEVREGRAGECHPFASRPADHVPHTCALDGIAAGRSEPPPCPPTQRVPGSLRRGPRGTRLPREQPTGRLTLRATTPSLPRRSMSGGAS